MVRIIGGIWNGFFFNIILWIFTLAGYPFLFNKLPALGGGKDR